MSGAPANKRPKFEGATKKFYKNVAKNFLEAGHRGFLATTNFREKECVRECYNILNNYADELYGADQLDYVEDSATIDVEANQPVDEESTKKNDGDEEEEEEDIATTLANELKTVAADNAKNNKKRRFQHVATGASNCVFIKTSLRDPAKLGVHIIQDVAVNRSRITRNVLRFIPVEAVCKANMLDMKNTAGKLFDKHFLNAPATTFSIVYNKRCNNDLNRDEIIRELASLVDSKNREHKVDLKSAHMSVLVEIVKGLCCMSVVPEYMQLKKYNLTELMSAGKPEDGAKTDDAKKTKESDATDAPTSETKTDVLKETDEKQEVAGVTQE